MDILLIKLIIILVAALVVTIIALGWHLVISNLSETGPFLGIILIILMAIVTLLAILFGKAIFFQSGSFGVDVARSMA